MARCSCSVTKIRKRCDGMWKYRLRKWQRRVSGNVPMQRITLRSLLANAGAARVLGTPSDSWCRSCVRLQVKMSGLRLCDALYFAAKIARVCFAAWITTVSTAESCGLQCKGTRVQQCCGYQSKLQDAHQCGEFVGSAASPKGCRAMCGSIFAFTGLFHAVQIADTRHTMLLRLQHSTMCSADTISDSPLEGSLTVGVAAMASAGLRESMHTLQALSKARPRCISAQRLPRLHGSRRGHIRAHKHSLNLAHRQLQLCVRRQKVESTGMKGRVCVFATLLDRRTQILRLQAKWFAFWSFTTARSEPCCEATDAQVSLCICSLFSNVAAARSAKWAQRRCSGAHAVSPMGANPTRTGPRAAQTAV